MGSLFRSDQERLEVGRNWGWFLLWGIALVILGIIAIGSAVVTTMLSIILLGFLILIGGVIIIVDSFAFWWPKGNGFALHIILGILYMLVGITFINNPVSGSISLTLILGTFYIVIGIIRIVYSVTIRLLRWQWNLLNGIVSLLLGILIIAYWPMASLYIIGLFVGIDLIFCGLAYINASLSAKSYT